MNLLLTGFALAALAALTLAIVWYLGLEHPFLQPIAIARAVVQLGLLSLVLSGIIRSPFLVGLFLAVMVLAASWVVHSRLNLGLRSIPMIMGIIVVASALPTLVIFSVGAVEASPRYLLALGGIVVGNAMTVSTLMGRGMLAAFRTDRDEIEGWLALGAAPRQAARRVVRAAATTALIPSTDQTRTTGMVTLPGSFVGAVFAGASPLVAAQFQLLVLAAVLAAGAITVAAWTWFQGNPVRLPSH